MPHFAVDMDSVHELAARNGLVAEDLRALAAQPSTQEALAGESGPARLVTAVASFEARWFRAVVLAADRSRRMMTELDASALRYSQADNHLAPIPTRHVRPMHRPAAMPAPRPQPAPLPPAIP